MKYIKDITINSTNIHIQLVKGMYINEYQMQLLNKEACYLNMHKEKRTKTQLVYDTENVCTLQTYLRSTSLQEESFLKLLIDILEKINEIQKTYYVYLSLETIAFAYDGTICFLVLPLTKEGYEAIDDDIQLFLVDVLKEVQVNGAYTSIGMIVQHVKSTNFRMLTLLQELHQQIPEEKQISIWKRFFFKAEPDLPITYPPPLHKSVAVSRDSYVEEIIEPTNETMLLFDQKTKTGYLENGTKRIAINSNEFHIGRNPDSDCYLNIPSISKSHALIVQEEEGFYIKDLKSANATYVNGLKLRPEKRYELKDNDEITLGNTTLEFHES